MKKTTVTLLAQTILTLDAGTHEAVREGGNLYLLVQQEEGGVEAPSTPKASAQKAEPKGGENIEEAPMPEKSSPAPAAKAVEKYTEKELMDTPTEELLDILDGMGIDPNKFEGKNTNKKLRLLILDAQSGKVVDDTAEEQAPAPKATRRGSVAKEEPRKLTEDEVDALEDGELILLKLDYDGDDSVADPDKLWEAEIIGWKIPDGGRVEKLHVKFQEDGAEDYIREGDEVYEYKTKI